MEELKMLGLQFFAGEGATAGEGTGADASTPGVEAAAPGQETQALEALGVPEIERKKYGAKMRSKSKPQEGAPSVDTSAADQQPAPTAEGETPAEEQPTKTLAELVRDDPTLNQELQGIISERVKGYARARDTLKELQPALELLAQQYGLEAKEGQGLDLAALTKAITEDERYWEDKAAELGVTPDVARKVVGYDKLQAAEEQRERDALEQQQFKLHVGRLFQQAEELKKLFPDFDLRRELDNEKFRLFTSPQIGMSVKDAFYAIHHDEIRQAESALIAKRTQEAFAASVAAGAVRPQEGGGARAASTGDVAGRKWDRASIEQVKRDAEAARARGEKYYIR
ncbi:MAG: hypothetical protein IKI69_05665 [Oscillospiraceae bacterium]|nr:hypothetical protein [Oscillospiraceae bacterium]